MTEPIADDLNATMIAQSRVIAKGCRIREVERLVNMYGGKKSEWVKKSSPQFQFEDEDYEFHWYEHPGIGRFEIKTKKVNQP